MVISGPEHTPNKIFLYPDEIFVPNDRPIPMFAVAPLVIPAAPEPTNGPA